MFNKITHPVMLAVALLLLPVSMQSWASDKISVASKEIPLTQTADIKKAEMKKAEMQKMDAKKAAKKQADMKKEEVKKTATSKANTSKVDINKASAEQLTAINGIGKTKAQAIVDHREANGKFKKAEDLMEVKGIGAGTLKKITPFIAF